MAEPTVTDDVPEVSKGERAPRRGMSIFRGKEALGLFESGFMSFPEFDAEDQKALAADGPRSKNILLGGHDAVLFRGEGDDGFSLVKAWFGPHYVPPRHTHGGDCLYYVMQGSVTMGNQTLNAGDGFFVPDGAPYAYEAGPDGVTVLEFRTKTSIDMKIPGGQVERFRKSGRVADEQAEEWAKRRAEIVG
ncbi:MAG: cupin domain-containing protein [Acidimicrobiia bacterium]